MGLGEHGPGKFVRVSEARGQFLRMSYLNQNLEKICSSNSVRKGGVREGT